MTTKAAAKLKPALMQVARGNQVIGRWTLGEIQDRLAIGFFQPLDSFYDAQSSSWLNFSELNLQGSEPTPPKVARSACYCGSGLPFRVCCGLDKS